MEKWSTTMVIWLCSYKNSLLITTHFYKNIYHGIFKLVSIDTNSIFLLKLTLSVAQLYHLNLVIYLQMLKHKNEYN